MGLIRAGRGALGGTLADQWKEFFYCDSMGKMYWLQRDRSASPAVPLTQKETTTLFPTAAELLLRTDSVC